MPGDRIIFGAAALPEPDRDWLAAVERLPIESVWQGGHVLPRHPTGEAITRLALLTAWTERVRVGHRRSCCSRCTTRSSWPSRSPTSTPGRADGSRSASGVGGEFPDEFDAVGVPVRERGARTDEAHAGPAGAVGRRSGHAPRPLLRPRRRRRCDRSRPPGAGVTPVQPGGPPLLVVGPQGAGHAAGRPPRRRLDALPHVARRLRPLGAHDPCRRRGERSRPRPASSGCCSSTARSGATATGPATTWRSSSAAPTATSPRPCSSASPRRAPPTRWSTRFQEYVDAGVRHFVVSPAAPADTLEVVTLAAEEVLPRLSLPVGADVTP